MTLDLPAPFLPYKTTKFLAALLELISKVMSPKDFLFKNTLYLAEHLLEQVSHQALILRTVEIALHIVELHDGNIVFPVEPWAPLSRFAQMMLRAIFLIQEVEVAGVAMVITVARSRLLIQTIEQEIVGDDS